MSVDVVPFDVRFEADAAELLARCHASATGAASALDLRDVDVARGLVAAWQGTGPAVAALDGGTLVGFLAAGAPSFPGHQSAACLLQQHAAAGQDVRGTYRRLYAGLSGRLTALGAFEHVVLVLAAQRAVLASFVELGFGIDLIKGLRGLTEPAVTVRSAPDVRLREARADDIPDMLRLTLELQRYHAGPPMHRPALLDIPKIEEGFWAAFGDERRLVLVAEDQGRLIGLLTADPDKHYRGAVTIGITVVSAAARSQGVGGLLLSRTLDWAGRQGFTLCGAGWTSANLVSDAFWRGHGFVPAQYRLTRNLDSRVAWAGGQLAYGDFFPQFPGL